MPVARKSGEALARRAELQQRLGEVRDRLRVSALVQEGGQPAEDPQPLLRELDDIAGELARLIANINRTNAGAPASHTYAQHGHTGTRHSDSPSPRR